MTAFSTHRAQNGKPNAFQQFGGNSAFFAAQTKLSVGKADDAYEKEADSVAEKVVSKNNKQQSFLHSETFFPGSKTNRKFVNNTPKIQKKETDKDADKQVLSKTITPVTKLNSEIDSNKIIDKKEEKLHRKEMPELENEKKNIQKKSNVEDNEKLNIQKKKTDEISKEKDEKIQAKSFGFLDTSINLIQGLQSTKGLGIPLPLATKNKMEHGFQANFNGVRIHTNLKAVSLNNMLGAKAFTVGNEIYFNNNLFQPNTLEGQQLLAHELTHTIQQGASAPATIVEKPLIENVDAGNINSSAESSSTEILKIPNKNTENVTAFQETDLAENSDKNKAENSSNLVQTNQPISLENRKSGENEPIVENDEVKFEETETITPRSPEEDPNFQNLTERLDNTTEKQQAHEKADDASSAAQLSAKPPTNERLGVAQATQVSQMEDAKVVEFNADIFIANLKKKLDSMQLPKTQEQALNFDKNNNVQEINTASKADVAAQKTNSAQPITQTTKGEPNTASVSEREVKPLVDPVIGKNPANLKSAQAMPLARGNAEVTQPLQNNIGEVDQQMVENEVTEYQLSISNEPTFLEGLSTAGQARAHTETAPQAFRQDEQGLLENTKKNAGQTGEKGLRGMYNDRTASLNEVFGKQGDTATNETSKRESVSTDINAIYENTKKGVEAILEALDTSVEKLFTDGAKEAKDLFEAEVKRKMSAYKSRRYSGIIGKGKWVYDKLAGLPDEVNKFFEEGRKVYIDHMDKVIIKIANLVAGMLKLAKAQIVLGNIKVKDYVENLPKNLKQLGVDAAADIAGKFEDLEGTIDSKQDEIIDTLAQQYMDSLNEVDARIEEMKAENRGLIDKALDAINGIIETIKKLKQLISDLLSEISSVLSIILNDPIGFVSNLFTGIKQGFDNFKTNILTHLMAGFVQWLTGSLGPIGITIPEDIFSLKGIFSLVMQVLGLTWDYVREKAVSLLGEPVVNAMETGLEMFKLLRDKGIDGVWELIQDEFTDLKETIIDSIQNLLVTQVIEAGIKWLLNLLIPGAGFIKAIMAIKDFIVFFVESALMLIPSLIQAIRAMAAGSISLVADAIEKGLASLIPLVIKLFAKIIGLNGLVAKVQKIIMKIRKRIDRAITKLLLKAKKAFLKLVSKGKASVKGAILAIVQWWKARKKFKGDDDKNHELFLEGTEDNAHLMLASTPTTYAAFIASLEIDIENQELVTAKIQAVQFAKNIDKKIKERIGTVSDEERKIKEEAKKKDLQDLLNNLAPKTALLLGLKGPLPKSEIKFGTTLQGNCTVGSTMEANVLSSIGDPGSAPKENNELYDILRLRKEGGRTYYVRGHMLNEKLHGPGEWRNMTPLSQKGNKNHLKFAEKLAKIAVNSGSVVRYNVTANYGRNVEPIKSNKQLDDAAIPLIERENVKSLRNAEKNVPVSLTLNADLIKQQGKKWVKNKTLINKIVVDNPVDVNLKSYSTITK
ncbi:DUF4157 domain-containing protein [Aequorivita sp. CIP111184]|uniref:eCIS core domain-containing protein n=1 Tax=Aequorivita sp. CIP111184 TaxID=2211356 RepID=UPI000DBBE76D|nr:DUF4157 domain-containing protein [Aequorivita sp. CIP111184]SRX54970.1 hypothetical protein AEQU1_01990 [Aequorivita sp. CIP111184]